MTHGRARRFVPLYLLLFLATSARADGPTAMRSSFPDRRWGAVTAADAGLAGAGLATDPKTSLYANPALALEGGKAFRISGVLQQRNRDDLHASTTDYQDASGFPAVGEIGARLRFKGLGISAYYSQPHYEHEETRFVGIDPGTGEVTGDPFPRHNESTSSTGYAGLGAAVRLGNGLLLGAAAEGVFLKERFVSTPQVPEGVPADSFDTERTATVLGGAVGASYTAGGLVRIGAAYHLAGDATYDDGGSDQAPSVGFVGVRVGRSAGASGTIGARFLGARDVDLADPVSDPRSADARTEYAAGFNYLDPAGVWDLRIGGGASPRPSDDALKLSRFGVSIGGGTEGAHVALAYEHTAEKRESGRSSSRNTIALTVEVTP